MGYSHYWRNYAQHDPVKWRAFIEDIRKLVKESPVPLVTSIHEDEIMINGIQGQDCEDFFIQKHFQELDPDEKKFGNHVNFNCCKTRYYPYDLIVVAALHLYKYHLGDAVRISSDGRAIDFDAGSQLVKKIFNYDVRVSDDE